MSALAAALAGLSGCQVDSWFNPSVTGYWEMTPTTVPVLDRIDAIEERESYWAQATDPTPEDLMPNDLSYRITPGDVVTVGILDLYTPGQWQFGTRVVDAGGFLRVSELGDIQAAGLSVQAFEDVLVNLLEQNVITNPQVDVVVERGGAFRYTVIGAVPGNGLYTLSDPDLRLVDALANAGGMLQSVTEVYVIRQVPLSDTVEPAYERDDMPRDSGTQPPVDIDDLIEQLNDGGDPVSPGVFRQEGEPAIDIDSLEPPARTPPSVDIDDLSGDMSGGSWIYDEASGEWIRVGGATGGSGAAPVVGGGGGLPLYVERVIRIDPEAMRRGESRQNIVVRPNDRIYVKPPVQGVVYIDGQISRPGTYSLPAVGKLTLSRLVAAAGGLGQLAIPERVDLTRVVGDHREATIRLNLGAIRHRTEPDIVLKPDDHINIGTNFWATPLAVIRNGFRMTYGFGFLLDRNFGPDVFGPVPRDNS